MIAIINENKFKIRDCKDEDYRFVYNLTKKNMHDLCVKNWGGWDSKRFRNDFKKKNVKIIEYKTKRVAYYDLAFEDTFTHINNIQVSSRMQGKRLGTFLMGLMEKETKKRGIKRINLKVFNDNPAKRLYLRLGYEKIKGEGSTLVLEKCL